ncbi:unnamed protein product [Danaus chrysippus]|uniref:sn-1-specific diacylglycerol lipase ABHD11 n=1 Tax=Danaus chrysippus TaxID=151541 RepID=A0A8J2QBL8_9NEOP|nr:unnamed protein product [Danaus chrysippus]
MSDVPVVIIHGLLGSKKNWETMSKKISVATSKAVIAVDMRNHGESPHTDSHTYPELASDVLELINKLSISRTDIIGHSMGGRTGMVVALTKPDIVNSLIVVDISPISTPRALSDYFPNLAKAMRSVNFSDSQNVYKARNIAKEALVASGAIDSDAVGFILMNIGVRDDKSLGWFCNIDVLEKHFPDIASFPTEMNGKQYTGKTLFIGGENSRYLQAGDLSGIKNYFPVAELKYVQDAGHNVHADNPVAFFNLVKEFLTS